MQFKMNFTNECQVKKNSTLFALDIELELHSHQFRMGVVRSLHAIQSLVCGESYRHIFIICVHWFVHSKHSYENYERESKWYELEMSICTGCVRKRKRMSTRGRYWVNRLYHLERSYSFWHTKLSNGYIERHIFSTYIQIQPVYNRNIRQMCPFSAKASDLDFLWARARPCVDIKR